MSELKAYSRFRSKIAPLNEDGCVLWIGAKTNRGYGKMSSNDGVVFLKDIEIKYTVKVGE